METHIIPENGSVDGLHSSTSIRFNAPNAGTTPDAAGLENLHVIPQDDENFQEEPAPTMSFPEGETPPDEVQRVPEDTALHNKDPQAELLHWHYRLGHVSFSYLRAMANHGLLPSSILKAETPKCAGCMYGKSTRKPWCTRAPVNSLRVPAVEHPGDCISIDQLESTTPGFVAQMKGHLTRGRYRVTTIFVDHFSDLSFVHLQPSTSAEHTLQAKQAFEQFATDHGVQVAHYHADNGRFADNDFMRSCSHTSQTISFCGVNAHFQNG